MLRLARTGTLAHSLCACAAPAGRYPLSSGQARNAFASRGVFPGAHSFILPIYNCPIDHYLEVRHANPSLEHVMLARRR